MATIKSYSDLQQSRKLAEILPLESADQTWARIAIAGANLDVSEELQYRHGDMPFQYYNGIGTPCWSLASLLEQLPYELCDDDGNSLYLKIYKNDDAEYQLEYTDPNGDFESIETDWYEDFVDTCVEMIIKLKELKLL